MLYFESSNDIMLPLLSFSLMKTIASTDLIYDEEMEEK